MRISSYSASCIVQAGAAYHTARHYLLSSVSTLLSYVPRPKRPKRMIKRRGPSFFPSSLFPAVLPSALLLLLLLPLLLPHTVDAERRGSKAHAADPNEPASFFSLNSKDGQQWSLTNVRICARPITLCVCMCVCHVLRLWTSALLGSVVPPPSYSMAFCPQLPRNKKANDRSSYPLLPPSPSSSVMASTQYPRPQCQGRSTWT